MPSFTFPMTYKSGSGIRIGFGTIEVPEVSSRETRAILEQKDVTYRSHGGRLWMPSVLAENNGIQITVASFDRMILAQQSRDWDFSSMLHRNPFVENYSHHMVDMAMDSSAEDPVVAIPVDEKPMSDRLLRSPEWKTMSEQASRTMLIGEVFHELSVGPWFILTPGYHDNPPTITWRLGTDRRHSSYDIRSQHGYREYDAVIGAFPDAVIQGMPPEVLESFEDGFDSKACASEAIAWTLLKNIRTSHLGDLNLESIQAMLALRQELESRLPGRVLNYASQTGVNPRHFSEIVPDASHVSHLVKETTRAFGIGYFDNLIDALEKRPSGTNVEPMDEDTADAIGNAFG